MTNTITLSLSEYEQLKKDKQQLIKYKKDKTVFIKLFSFEKGVNHCEYSSEKEALNKILKEKKEEKNKSIMVLSDKISRVQNDYGCLLKNYNKLTKRNLFQRILNKQQKNHRPFEYYLGQFRGNK